MRRWHSSACLLPLLLAACPQRENTSEETARLQGPGSQVAVVASADDLSLRRWSDRASTASDGVSADWPAFRGADGLATSAAAAPVAWGPDENVAWKTPLPGAGGSTPIVLGGAVYLTCYSGYQVPGEPRGSQAGLRLHLVRLDRATGEIQFDREIEPNLPERNDIREGHGYASNTAVADEERVFAFFGKTGVFAFDHAGNRLWHADVGSNLHGWGSGASLLLAGDKLIVNASVESETLYALDVATGKEVWSTGDIKESWNTPILVTHEGRSEIVIASFGTIRGIDPNTGDVRWHCATDIPWYMVPSLIAHEGVVYAIGGRPGGGLAVRLGGSGDVTATHRLWTSRKGGNVSSPVYHDGHLYWMHDNLGIAFCADAATGAVVYEERIARAGQVYGSAVLAGGHVYYPARNGTTYVVAAKPTFELVATNTLEGPGRHNASFAVADGRIYLRTNQYAYCIADE